MKYTAKGLTDYNLSDIELRIRAIRTHSDSRLVSPKLLNTGEKGDILRAYEMKGLSFYDMPLFYKAPLFPAMLALSHRMFTRGDQPFLVVMSNLREGVRTADKKMLELFFKAQFWAAIVPLASNLAVILVTFFLGRLLFDSRIGLVAAYLMAIQPVGIVTSNRLLADDFFSMWVILALFIFYWAYHRNSFLGSLCAGICLGLSLLTKQNALLLLPIVWLYIFAVSRKIFSAHFLIFAATGLFLSAHWYLRVYNTYGTPLYHPGYAQMVEMSTDMSRKWFQVLDKRPHPSILFSVGIPYVCPPMIFLYATLKQLWTEARLAWTRATGANPWLFLWFWLLAFFLFFVFRAESKEERYLLPAYPAIAVLAAAGLEKIRQWAKPFFVQPMYVDAVIVIFLAFSAWWAVPLAWETIFDERYLLMKPF